MAVEAAFACSGTLGFGSRGYNLQRNSDLFILLEVEKRTLRIRTPLTFSGEVARGVSQLDHQYSEYLMEKAYQS